MEQALVERLATADGEKAKIVAIVADEEARRPVVGDLVSGPDALATERKTV